MRGRQFAVGERGISKEGMAAIAFALTVGMMAVTGGLLIQSSGNLSSGGPILSASTEPVESGTGSDDQWLRIEHESGDPVEVRNLSVNVSVPDHRKRAAVHGLPTAGLTQDDYTGNHLFTLGPAGVAGEASTDDGDGVWASGDTIALRIEDRRVDLQPGETVEVSVYHVSERTQLYSETVSVV